MKITILDAATLGDDLSMDVFEEIGNTEVFDMTSEEDVSEKNSSRCSVDAE